MSRVLLVADHEPTARELPALLRGIAELSLDEPEVTVLMPIPPPRTGALMDEVAAARGMSYRAASVDMRAGRTETLSQARRRLNSVVASLRSAGHLAHGELVGPATPRTVLTEVSSREPDAVLLLSSPHRVAHLLHHDLEARLRHTCSKVVSVHPERTA